MALKRVRLVLLVALTAAVVLSPPDLTSCGPFFSSAVFTPQRSAGAQEDLDAGKLGVVFRGFDPRSLVITYRVLSGTGNTRRPKESAPETNLVNLPARWLAVRSKVPGVQKLDYLRVERSIGKDYEFFTNCLDDAFESAIRTANARSAKWGVDSADFREWLQGQDQVFANCPEGEHIPSVLPNGADPLLAADREYQIASAHFYAGHWAEAEMAFGAVAQNKTSPWSPLGRYLVARTLIRKATLASDAGAMARAADVLRSILADPALKSTHGAAERMSGFVRARLEPSKVLTELGAQLSKPDATDRDLDEYLYVHKKLKAEDRAPAEQQNEMTAWVDEMEGGASSQATARWSAKAGQTWLLASLSAAKHDDARIGELLAAARAVPKSSPAYPSAVYYGARLEIGRKNGGAARKWIDDGLSAAIPEPAKNALRAERMKLAGNFAEFLQFAPRNPVGTIFDGGPDFEDMQIDAKIRQPMFDTDAAEIFSHRLPLNLWSDALKAGLPAPLPGQIAAAGWLRAVLLGRDAEAQAFARTIGLLRPELAKSMAEYQAAGDADSRNAAAFLILLRNPGINPLLRPGFQRDTKIDAIDNFRDNWWSFGDDKNTKVAEALFLPPRDRERGDSEWTQLKKTAANGQELIAASVVRWAKAHADDPRVPEVLARTVITRRYSMSAGTAPNSSREAFQLLKSRYKGTEAEKKTKYWYE